MAVVLGIDPGSRTTGYGVVAEKNGRLCCLASGCIQVGKYNVTKRLAAIYQNIQDILIEYPIEEVAIEQVFMHQNIGGALKLGQARGAAIAAVGSRFSTIAEYAPREVKQAVVGYGAAKKEQIQHMIVRLLALKNAPSHDAADALAIAVCHLHFRKIKAYLEKD